MPIWLHLSLAAGFYNGRTEEETIQPAKPKVSTVWPVAHKKVHTPLLESEFFKFYF